MMTGYRREKGVKTCETEKEWVQGKLEVQLGIWVGL